MNDRRVRIARAYKKVCVIFLSQKSFMEVFMKQLKKDDIQPQKEKRVSIRKVRIREMKELFELKKEAFLPILKKYQDEDTNPARETIDKLCMQLSQMETEYYMIRFDEKQVGAVRVVQREEETFRISPVFILEKYQNMGIASFAMKQIFQMYQEAEKWELCTIQEEKRNCHFYEKLGFLATGNTKTINDKMTLIEYVKEMDK